MSALIKGMKIPKNCLECMFRISYWKRALTPSGKIFTYGCMLNGKEINMLEKRCKDCPIVGISTPHGRLIDADQLQTAIHGLLCENCVTFSCEKGIGCLIEDVFNLIDEAPAVIEAEHESEAQKWARVGRDISKGLQEGIEAIDSEGIEE